MFKNMTETKKSAALPIVQEGHPALHTRAKEVPHEMFGTPELEKIIEEMSVSLRTQKDGVAIAAPQVAYSWRIFVVRGYVMQGMDRKDDGAQDISDVAFINPEFVEISDEKQLQEEACLSCRGYYVNIKVPTHIKVKAQHEDGTWFEADGNAADGTQFLAKVFRHETAHLNGRVIITKGESEEVYKFDPELPDPKNSDKLGVWVRIEGIEYPNAATS